MILINVKIPIRPDRAEEWATVAAQYAKDVTAEPGNVFFEWYRSVDDPNQYIAVEGFVDGAAGAAHMATDHVKQFMATAPDYVAERPQVIFVDSPDITGWGPMGEITPR